MDSSDKIEITEIATKEKSEDMKVEGEKVEDVTVEEEKKTEEAKVEGEEVEEEEKAEVVKEEEVEEEEKVEVVKEEEIEEEEKVEVVKEEEVEGVEEEVVKEEEEKVEVVKEEEVIEEEVKVEDVKKEKIKVGDVKDKEKVEVQPAALRKGSLRTSDAVAQSIALLALVMGVALSTSLAAGSAGAAVPLAYIVTGLGSLCLAYVIIRFTRHMASAGGVYAYTAQGLGPSVGFISGWMYAGAFAIGISFVLAIASDFLSSLFANVHISVDWFIIYCVLLVILFLCAFFDIRVSTRTQLVLAALGVLSVLVLVVAILVQGGDSGVSAVPFSPAALPTGLSGLFFATVFSFTSFIGFEAAAVLGEETSNPRYAIPRAILIAVLVAAVFYILTTYAMSIGYGVAHADKWAADQAPLDTLANRYTNPILATIIDLMVAFSAFIGALAGVNLTSRMLFAMGRDKGIPGVFALTHSRYKTPWVGILASLLLTFVLGVTLGRSLGVFTFFGFLATTGSLGILVAYILVALSGIVYFSRLRKKGGTPLSAVLDVVLPIIAILLCGATLYSSIIPVPPPPLNYAPYLVAAWLVIGVIVLVLLWARNPERVRQFGHILGE